MIYPEKIRTVAFDIDGTLYPNYQMYFFSIPFAITHLRLLTAFAHVRRDIRKVRPIDDLGELQITMTAEKLGWSTEKTKTAIEKNLYGRWERVLQNVVLVRGVSELLSGLPMTGRTTVAMSDFPVNRKLEYLGLEGRFDHAFSSEDTNYLKPNPEPFIRILELTGDEPGQVLYVGNSCAYDIEGARSVGMQTALFTSSSKKSVKGQTCEADLHFTRYTELSAILLA